MLIGSKIVAIIGRRNFTTLSTFLNAAGFYLVSRKDIPYSVWIGDLLMLPGFNANHSSAMKSYATDHAVASGFGKGEFAAAIAALGSLQVESALITVIVSPFSNDPESEASLKAISAESAIAGVRDSIGPVNPKIIPILTSAKTFVVNVETNMNAAINSFFISILLLLLTIYKK